MEVMIFDGEGRMRAPSELNSLDNFINQHLEGELTRVFRKYYDVVKLTLISSDFQEINKPKYQSTSIQHEFEEESKVNTNYILESLSSFSGAHSFFLQVLKKEELKSLERQRSLGARLPSICPTQDEEVFPLEENVQSSAQKPKSRNSNPNSANKLKNSSSKLSLVEDHESIEKVAQSPKKSVSRTDLCPICFDSFGRQDSIAVLKKCSHTFHVKCINLWFVTCENPAHSCPVCKAKL